VLDVVAPVLLTRMYEMWSEGEKAPSPEPHGVAEESSDEPDEDSAEGVVLAQPLPPMPGVPD